jgi:hypothetical protein
MMAAINDITGDSIASKVPSKNFLDNYDAIFRKNKQQETQIDAFKQSIKEDEAIIQSELASLKTVKTSP